MAQRLARETALAALRLWRKEKRFADSIISRFLASSHLASSDRAFALELFYGVLRNLTLLDFWIGCLRVSRIETNVRDFLRLGLYQVLVLKTPEHAAVHETVAIAPQKQRSITNAVLRAATRQRACAQSSCETPSSLAVRSMVTGSIRVGSTPSPQRQHATPLTRPTLVSTSIS